MAPVAEISSTLLLNAPIESTDYPSIRTRVEMSIAIPAACPRDHNAWRVEMLDDYFGGSVCLQRECAECNSHAMAGGQHDPSQFKECMLSMKSCSLRGGMCSATCEVGVVLDWESSSIVSA